VARPSKTIRLDGFEELIRKLGAPALSRQPIEEMLTAAAKLGERAAIIAISGGSGVAERSIRHMVSSRRLFARVFTMIARPRAMSIEKGRLPGETVTSIALARWLTGSAGRTPVLSEEERKQVFVAQAAIRQHGAKGKFYILAAREVIDREMPRLKETALRRLRGLMKV